MPFLQGLEAHSLILVSQLIPLNPEKYQNTFYKICTTNIWIINVGYYTFFRGLHGCDRMVVRFTTTYAISAYQH